jgi:hypothetical protein
MPRLRPHQPIFQQDIIRGSIQVGNTPVGSPIPSITLVGLLDLTLEESAVRYLTVMGTSGRVLCSRDSAQIDLIDYGTDPTTPTSVANLATAEAQVGSDVAWFNGNNFAMLGDSLDEVSIYSAVPGTIAHVGSVTDTDYLDRRSSRVAATRSASSTSPPRHPRRCSAA